jgi:hypothetical protein
MLGKRALVPTSAHSHFLHDALLGGAIFPLGVDCKAMPCWRCGDAWFQDKRRFLAVK